MVRALRTALPCRLGAVAVAIALTGAPALAERPQEVEHRCHCRAHAGEHECECVRCRMGAAAKQGAASAAVPPCHPHVAARKKHADARPASGDPCMSGTCGADDRLAAPLAAADAFTIPRPHAPFGALPLAGSVARASGTARDAPSRPEPPPPRTARARAGRA